MIRPRTSSGTSAWRVPVRTGKHNENPKPMSPTLAAATGRDLASAVPVIPTNDLAQPPNPQRLR